MNENYDKEESIINDEIFRQDMQKHKLSHLRPELNTSSSRQLSDFPSLLASMTMNHDKNKTEVSNHSASQPKRLVTYKVEHNAVERYKKTIRLRIFAVVSIVCLLLFGRIFASFGTDVENQVIIQFQQLFGVSETPSWYAKLFSYIGYSQNVDILLVSHFYVSFYFLYKPVFCLKVIVVHITSTSIVPLLQIIFADPRPFWVTADILSVDCPNSYPYPSLTAFTIPFLFLYTGYVITQEEENPKFQRIFIAVTVVVYFYITVTEMYAGFLYSYQIILSLFYTILYYFVVQMYDKTLDRLIEQSSIDIRQAKRYTLFWLIFVILFAFIGAGIYAGSDAYVNPTWIQNFYECLENNELLENVDGVPTNHVLGAWPSFINTSTIFIVIGAIFGTAKTFRDLRGILWYDSDYKNRWKMVIVANLCLIPSWIYFLYIFATKGLVKSGILAYISNATLFVGEYCFIFGVLPKHVFHRFEWTNRISSIVQS